jgi:LysM repeat protein
LNGPVLVHLPATGLSRARVMLPRLIDDAERDLSDLQVALSFDWGRDDLDSETEQRLAATASNEHPLSRRALQLDRTDRYFGANPMVGSSRWTSKNALDELDDDAFAPPRASTRRFVAYTVTEGDTLGGIAQFFGVRLTELLRDNELRANNVIRSGAKIRVSIAPRVGEGAEPGVTRAAEADKTAQTERAETSPTKWLGESTL